MASKADLVNEIKVLQRTDANVKQEWSDYCDAHLGGVKDPNRHDAVVLQTFLESVGAPPGEQGGVGAREGQAALVQQVKSLQRTDPMCKQAWAEYCDEQLGGVRDPSRHDAEALSMFLGAYAGGAISSFAGIADHAGAATSGQRGSSPAGAAAPRAGHGRGADHDTLVQQVKTLQRCSPEAKQAWAEYCDQSLGCVRDPGKHDSEVLRTFLNSHGQPGPSLPPAARGGGGRAPGGWEGQSEDHQLLVEQVKNLQRSDPALKQAWVEYCDTDLGGTYDPSRHTAGALRAFVETYGTGVATDASSYSRSAAPPRGAPAAAHGGGGGGSSTAFLGELVRAGQKSAKSWKEAWEGYCTTYGDNIMDPRKHEHVFLVGFLEYLGDLGKNDLRLDAGSPTFRSKRGAPEDWPAPPTKRTSGRQHQSQEDTTRTVHVERIKDLQRQDQAIRQAWADFVDEHHGRVRDPARHERSTLETFLSRYDVRTV